MTCILISTILLIIILLCISTISRCEVYYIRPSELLNDADHHLTLSQFVKNSSGYLASDTQLIFAPGNHSLEDKLLVENLHSFNISVESTSTTSSRAVIVCDYDGRFEFSNTATVNVNGWILLDALKIMFHSLTIFFWIILNFIVKL